MIRVLCSDGTTRLMTNIEYEETRALFMEKNGNFREGESRSDFDMTKKANLEILGADSFFVGAEKADKTIIGKMTMGTDSGMPFGPNYGKDKFE